MNYHNKGQKTLVIRQLIDGYYPSVRMAFMHNFVEWIKDEAYDTNTLR
jgi:hypothetical protein